MPMYMNPQQTMRIYHWFSSRNASLNPNSYTKFMTERFIFTDQASVLGELPDRYPDRLFKILILFVCNGIKANTLNELFQALMLERDLYPDMSDFASYTLEFCNHDYLRLMSHGLLPYIFGVQLPPSLEEPKLVLSSTAAILASAGVGKNQPVSSTTLIKTDSDKEPVAVKDKKRKSEALPSESKEEKEEYVTKGQWQSLKDDLREEKKKSSGLTKQLKDLKGEVKKLNKKVKNRASDPEIIIHGFLKSIGFKPPQQAPEESLTSSSSSSSLDSATSDSSAFKPYGLRSPGAGFLAFSPLILPKQAEVTLSPLSLSKNHG